MVPLRMGIDQIIRPYVSFTIIYSVRPDRNTTFSCKTTDTFGSDAYVVAWTMHAVDCAYICYSHFPSMQLPRDSHNWTATFSPNLHTLPPSHTVVPGSPFASTGVNRQIKCANFARNAPLPQMLTHKSDIDGASSLVDRRAICRLGAATNLLPRLMFLVTQ